MRSLCSFCALMELGHLKSTICRFEADFFKVLISGCLIGIAEPRMLGLPVTIYYAARMCGAPPLRSTYHRP